MLKVAPLLELLLFLNGSVCMCPLQELKDIIAHVASRVATSPVFRRKLHRLPFDFDFPYWVEDKDFDLEAHLSHARLPRPGDWRQFCIQVARHFSRPMDMTRPLWDMYVVEGLDNIPGIAPAALPP